MIKRIITNSPYQTHKVAKNLAEFCLQRDLASLIIGLIGELGSGKTTFIQGFAKALGIKKRITSPTFVLMKKFKIKNLKLKIKNLYHLDAYRISRPKELIDLGWKEIIQEPKNIIIIEWAEKIKSILPADCLIIKFKHLGRKKRKITVKNGRQK